MVDTQGTSYNQDKLITGAEVDGYLAGHIKRFDAPFRAKGNCYLMHNSEQGTGVMTCQCSITGLPGAHSQAG